MEVIFTITLPSPSAVNTATNTAYHHGYVLNFTNGPRYTLVIGSVVS